MIGRRLALEGRSVLGAADELLKLAVERAGGLVVDKSACVKRAFLHLATRQLRESTINET